MAFYDDGDDRDGSVTIDLLMAAQPKPLCSDAEAMEAYQNMFSQCMEHGSSSARILAGLLLNSYNDRLGSPFNIGQMRRLDVFNRRSVLHYLDFYGRTNGWYPPEDDIKALKARWVEESWGSADRA